MKTTILVCDDEELNREMLVEYLTERNYKVIGAVHGLDCLEKIEKCNPEAMILDLNMPYLDGFGVLQKLEEAARQIPTIVLTGQGSITDAVRATKQGAYEFLQKPVSLELVEEELKSALLAAKEKKLAAKKSGLAQEFINSIRAGELKEMTSYHWPTNPDELANLLKHWTGALESHCPSSSTASPFTLPEEGLSLDLLEKSLLEQAMVRVKGNQSQAAKLLGITRFVLRYRLEKHQLVEAKK